MISSFLSSIFFSFLYTCVITHKREKKCESFRLFFFFSKDWKLALILPFSRWALSEWSYLIYSQLFVSCLKQIFFFQERRKRKKDKIASFFFLFLLVLLSYTIHIYIFFSFPISLSGIGYTSREDSCFIVFFIQISF